MYQRSISIAIVFFVLSSFALAQQSKSAALGNFETWLSGKSEPYKDTKSLDDAIETLRHQFVDEGLSDFMPLLSKARIVRGIELSLAVRTKGHPTQNASKHVDTDDFHKLWAPKINEIAKNGKWPKGSFLALNSHTIPNYCDHVSVQLYVRHDGKRMKLFNIPILDITFGEWLPIQGGFVTAEKLESDSPADTKNAPPPAK